MKKNTWKVIIALILVIVTVASIACLNLSANDKKKTKYANADFWDGSVDTSWYVADAKEIHITKAAQLAGLAQLVNDGTDSFVGKTVYLDCDLVLNEGNFTADDAGEPLYDNNPIDKTNNPVNEWTPIGNYSADTNAPNIVDTTSADAVKYAKGFFLGSFDGQGHVVSGIYINNADNAGGNFKGLFGVFCGEKLENLGIINTYIKAAGRTGAVAGLVLNTSAKATAADDYTADVAAGNFTSLKNLYTDAYIRAAHTKGSNRRSGVLFGIVRIYDKDDAYTNLVSDTREKGGVIILENCWANGTVNGGTDGRFCGGICANVCGYDAKNAGRDGFYDVIFKNCLTTSTVVSPGTAAGGFWSETYQVQVHVINSVSALKAATVGESECGAFGGMIKALGYVFAPEATPSYFISVGNFKNAIGKVDETLAGKYDISGFKPAVDVEDLFKIAADKLDATVWDLKADGVALKGVPTVIAPYVAPETTPVTTAKPIVPPVVTTAPPVVTTAPPAVTTAPPAVTTAPPAVTTAPPAVETTAPVVEETTVPVVETTTPTDEETGCSCGKNNAAMVFVQIVAIMGCAALFIGFKKKF